MDRHLRLIFSCFATGLLLVGCDKKEDVALPASAPSPASTNQAAAPVVNPQFAALAGKWQRADGDYLVEIKNVEPGGKLDVGYFNPSPIHVSRAAAFEKDGGTKVFIELQDVNYPGSTYTLAYDPKSDQLFGQYFQAAMKETFDVVFSRAKAQ